MAQVSTVDEGLVAARAMQERVRLELVHLQSQPGAHPSLVKLKAPTYHCLVSDDESCETKALVRWTVEADGISMRASLRQSRASLHDNGARYPRLDPVRCLQIFDLVLKLSTAAPVSHGIDDEFKCLFLGAVSALDIDQYVFNPFFWEEQAISNLRVVVALSLIHISEPTRPY